MANVHADSLFFSEKCAIFQLLKLIQNCGKKTMTSKIPSSLGSSVELSRQCLNAKQANRG